MLGWTVPLRCWSMKYWQFYTEKQSSIHPPVSLLWIQTASLVLCVAFHKTRCMWGWVRLLPCRSGCRRGRVEVVRRNRPHMVLRSWSFWHISRMLTQSIERLSTGTDLTDSAQLLTCRGVHMDMRTKIACWDPQLDATVQNLNHCQFILSHINFSMTISSLLQYLVTVHKGCFG